MLWYMAMASKYNWRKSNAIYWIYTHIHVYILLYSFPILLHSSLQPNQSTNIPGEVCCWNTSIISQQCDCVQSAMSLYCKQKIINLKTLSSLTAREVVRMTTDDAIIEDKDWQLMVPSVMINFSNDLLFSVFQEYMVWPLPCRAALFQTMLISRLLMPWLLAVPLHQQLWHWLYWTGQALSSMRKDINCLYCFSVDEWYRWVSARTM